MRNLLNPQQKGKLALEATQCHYRIGDKVIHLVNDAEVNVFNGDLRLSQMDSGKYTSLNKMRLSLISMAMRSSILETNGTKLPSLCHEYP